MLTTQILPMSKKTKMQNSSQKITEKYKRLAHKRKLKPTPAAVTIDGFQNPSKKRKKHNKISLYNCQKHS